MIFLLNVQLRNKYDDDDDDDLKIGLKLSRSISLSINLCFFDSKTTDKQGTFK